MKRAPPGKNEAAVLDAMTRMGRTKGFTDLDVWDVRFTLYVHVANGRLVRRWRGPWRAQKNGMTVQWLYKSLIAFARAADRDVHESPHSFFVSR